MLRSSSLIFILFAATLASSPGCVRRQFDITSEPSGALVYLNDREVGRTPLRTDFVWYGTYDVTLRREGFETLNKRTRVVAPWWGFPPIDLAAELMPWHPTDRRKLNYVMRERIDEPPPDSIVERGLELRRRLPATNPSDVSQ